MKAAERKLLLTAEQTGDYSRARQAMPELLLTPRELDIMRATAAGSSINQIAETLRVSRKGVESMKYRAFRKLGFHSVVMLVHWALYHRLTPNLIKGNL